MTPQLILQGLALLVFLGAIVVPDTMVDRSRLVAAGLFLLTLAGMIGG